LLLGNLKLKKDKKSGKERFIGFFKSIDIQNGVLLDRVVKNQDGIVDHLQMKQKNVGVYSFIFFTV
jgi:hypothetical protein